MVSTIIAATSELKCVQKDGYQICQSGSHIQGNFIQVFVPDSPYRDKQGKLKLIVYLHGFALCIPKFYEDHLKVLAQSGYYVFFPDFQKSEYPDNLEVEKTRQAGVEKSHLSVWSSRFFKAVTDGSSKGNRFPSEDSFSEQQSEEVPVIQGNLAEPSRFSYLRVSLALVVFIVVVKFIYSWFNRNYGKHLIKLISTVGFSLMYKPSEWIKNAINLTDQTWQKLCEDNPNLAQQEFDFYVFGHSLGGLLALSWPAFSESQQKFFPKQILTADPAVSTEMGIPQIAIWILKLFHSPFTQEPISIRETGSKLNIPVGIMHGADDTLVKPQSWVKPSFLQTKSNFNYIASQQKKIYFSFSNLHIYPPLIAFHNQAVTDTTYFDDALFEKFGGVKKGPNDYNNQYVWCGLSLVVADQVRADQLLETFHKKTVTIRDTLPDKPWDIKSIAIASFVVLALLGLGYWFLHYGTLLSQ